MDYMDRLRPPGPLGGAVQVPVFTLEEAVGTAEPKVEQAEAAPKQPSKSIRFGTIQEVPSTEKVMEERPRKKILTFQTIFPPTPLKSENFQNQQQARVESDKWKSLTTSLQEQDEHSEGPCAFACIVIPFCQRFNNIRCFMIFYCILLVSQGIVFGLVDLSITYFQNVYHLEATESLALSFAYDVSSCLVAIFIAYYGGRGNRPRWLAVSSILTGAGSLLCFHPYVIGGDYRLKVEVNDVCQGTKVIGTCQDVLPSFQSRYTAFFILGQIIQGIAAVPVYTHGITFLHDSTDIDSLGIYLGLQEVSKRTGYALAIVMAIPQVQTSLHSTSIKRVKLREGSIRWLWTWWIDFLLAACIAWSTLIPLLCFPHSLPGTAKLKAEKRNRPDWPDTRLDHLEFRTSMKDLFASVWILMKNQVFICLALSRVAEYLLMAGFSQFLAKYIENQYELTSTTAAIFAGFVLLPGGAIGQLLGGVIISKLKMSCKAIMKFVMAISAVTLILFMLTVFVHCETIQRAGITENYEGTGQLGNLIAPCNSHCECSSSFYSSICGRDNIEYFSPCFGGCKDTKIFGSQRLYYNCSCITKGLSTQDHQNDFSDATSGKCDAKCYKLPLFISFIFSAIIFAGFSGVPLTVAILRTVSEEQHSVALGMALVILRIFGTIPGPVVFKTVRESACIFHDNGLCGRVPRCWIYSRTKLVYLLVGICFLCKGFTIFLTAVALYISSRPAEGGTHLLSTPQSKRK